MTSPVPLYAPNFCRVNPYWPCGKAPIPYSQRELRDYFSPNVQAPVHISVEGETFLADIQATMLSCSIELMLDAFLVNRKWLTVKETGLRGICFFREYNLNPNRLCLVLNLLEQVAEWDVLERLLLCFPHFDFLFPAVVLANYEATDTMLEAGLNNELARMMEVVFRRFSTVPNPSLVSKLDFPAWEIHNAGGGKWMAKW